METRLVLSLHRLTLRVETFAGKNFRGKKLSRVEKNAKFFTLTFAYGGF